MKRICLIAMFKNESKILNEWIEHYISEGVDKFLLIDNNSNDNYRETIEKHIMSNKVEIVVDKTPGRKGLQTSLYNKYFLKKSKLYDWAIICDLDEFIYSRRGFPTIKSYLSILPRNVSQVCIPWKMYGSSGYNIIDKKQPDSVVDNFTKRSIYQMNHWDRVEWGEGNVKSKIVTRDNKITVNRDKYNFAKSIVRTKDLIRFDVHLHNVKHRSICSNNRSDLISHVFCKINKVILDNSCLHLNHYAIQSLRWFMNVKVKRGASNNSSNSRDINYYRKYDKYSNLVDDDELYNKKQRRNNVMNVCINEK